MKRVVDAGVPAPCARAEQLGDKHVPGLRIESFLEGEQLDLNRLAPRQVARLVLHLGEAMQRLHKVVARGYGLLAEDLTAPGDSYTWMRDQLEQETLLALLWMDKVIAPAQSIGLAAKALAMLDDCPYADPPVLCHGDINPGNVLVREDRLAGLIDWEFVQGNDPAYDCALFLAFTSEYWHPSLDNTFIAQVIEAFGGKADPELDRRVNAYLQLCMLQELNVAVQFSLIQPWRNAEKMRDYLLRTSLQ
jgi:Ser/Thr protein kinase RdoA (MazF antagonist)